MRLLVTGSRTITDRLMIERGLERARYEFYSGVFSLPFDDTLVHGGARGVDTIAGDIWMERRWGPVEVHHADWEALGKRAGFVRNADMVRYGADLCVAFIKDASPGATMCARIAEEAGIKVIRITA